VRFDVFHKFLEGEFSVQLHQLTKPFEVQIKKNAVAHLPPPSHVILTSIETDTRGLSVVGSAVRGILMIGWRHVHGKRNGNVHGRLL
jgi:hypothetical protein